MPPDEMQDQPSGDEREGIMPPDQQLHGDPAALSSVPDAPQDSATSEPSSLLRRELTKRCA